MQKIANFGKNVLFYSFSWNGSYRIFFLDIFSSSMVFPSPNSFSVIIKPVNWKNIVFFIKSEYSHIFAFFAFLFKVLPFDQKLKFYKTATGSISRHPKLSFEPNQVQFGSKMAWRNEFWHKILQKFPVARRHHAKTIKYLESEDNSGKNSGDVFDLTFEMLDKLPLINLFCETSPCNNVSKANPYRTGVDDNYI